MKRIVAIAGDYYHEEDIVRQSLESSLASDLSEKRIQLEYTDVRSLPQKLRELPDAVVMFTEDRISPEQQPDARWMTEEISAQIAAYVQQGGSWIAWHSGLASFAVDSDYVKMLRGYFLSHPVEHPVVTYMPVANPEIEVDVPPFEFADEHYFVNCDKERTTVIMTSSSSVGTSEAGWVHHFGQGKVACLTPAHLREGLMHPSFLLTLRKVIEWSLEK